MAGSGFSPADTDANASRVIQGFFTSIGFLGAGVIVKGAGKSHVHGMTTAAAIWLTSALGIVCGLGAYLPVTVGLILLCLLLGIGGRIDHIIDARWAKKCGNDTEESEVSGQRDATPDLSVMVPRSIQPRSSLASWTGSVSWVHARSYSRSDARLIVALTSDRASAMVRRLSQFLSHSA